MVKDVIRRDAIGAISEIAPIYLSRDVENEKSISI
jgi:hypothetical protein